MQKTLPLKVVFQKTETCIVRICERKGMYKTLKTVYDCSCNKHFYPKQSPQCICIFVCAGRLNLWLSEVLTQFKEMVNQK